MPNLFEILHKSYRYTKNHKFLWFFGFFLTWGGSLNFIRFVDFQTSDWARSLTGIRESFVNRPVVLAVSIVAGIIILFVAMSLGALSRASLIWSGLHLERREQIDLHKSVNNGIKSFWRVLGLGVLINVALLFILLWVGLPTLYIFSHGYVFRGIVIAFIALLIFAPMAIALSMVNVFGSCFIVVYNFKIGEAFKAAVDLFSRYWDRTIGLMIILLGVYVFLFVISASVLGVLGVLAYLAVIVLKSLAIPFFIGTISLFLIFVSIVLLTVNAVLNVFNNLAWTLFFLRIVKAKRFPEEEAVVIEPAI